MSPKIEMVTYNTKIETKPVSIDPKKFQNLKNLNFAEHYPHEDLPIDILLSNYWTNYFITHEIIKTTEENIFALNTKFGYVLQGTNKHYGSNNPIMFTNSITQNLPNDTHNDDNPYELLKKLFQLESIGIDTTVSEYSEEELLALQRFKEYTYYNREEKRFYTSLLWKDPQVKIAGQKDNNLQRSFAVMKSHLRKLSPTHKQLVNDSIAELLQEGYIEKIPKHEINKKKCYYTEVIPLIKEKRTTTKCRLLFNLKSKLKHINTSINSFMLQGPPTIGNLAKIFLHFRLQQVALIADVQRMFYNVFLDRSNDDVDYQRFIWSSDNDTTPIHYRLITLCFGNVSSPFINGGVLQTMAELFQKEFPTAASILRKNTYCDDIAISLQTEKETTEAIQEIQGIFNMASMTPHKFLTNSQRVLEKIPHSLRAEETRLKVLGTLWNSTTDELIFDLTCFQNRPTKITMRSIASEAASLFDPHGIAIFITIRIKSLIQRLWTLRYVWEDELKNEELKEYEEWKQSIKDIKQIKMQRVITPPGEILHQYIAIFCDASEISFAALAYIVTFTKEKSRSSLIFCKNRLAPLSLKKSTETDTDTEIKKLSIVRLELLAALLGARLSSFLRETFPHIKEHVLFSDSLINIYRIKYKNNKQYKIFTGSKLKEIHNLTSAENWRFVEGIQNPADIPTRIFKPQDVINNKNYWNGPDFLLDYSRKSWPKQTRYGLEKGLLNIETKERVPENKTTNSIFLTTISNQSEIHPLKFESWQKNVRIRAWIQRAILTFKNKKTKTQLRTKQIKKINSGYDVDKIKPLTLTEIRAAETYYFSHAQKNEYPDDFQSLKNKQPLQKTSKLRQISCYYDENDDVIKLHSRLVHHKYLTNITTNPIILPPKSDITRQYILYIHKRNFRMLPECVHAVIRQQFHLPRGRETIRNVLRKCTCCKNSRPLVPFMETVPLYPFEHQSTFHTVQLDFIGPYFCKHSNCNIKDCVHGNYNEKVFVLLYICLNTKFIGGEVLHNIDTHNVLMVIDNLSLKYGKPSIIQSDCALQFKSASTVLRQKLKTINWDKLRTDGSKKGIEWKLGIEKSSFGQGVIERHIRIIKNSFDKNMKSKKFTFSEFQNIINAACGNSNSRPLTIVREEGSDLFGGVAVTPHELVYGRPFENLYQNSAQEAKNNSYASYRRHRIAITNQNWKRFHNDYLLSLRLRPKWKQTHQKDITANQETAKPNQLVLVRDKNQLANTWKIARIDEAIKNRDGIVNRYKLTLPNGSKITRHQNNLSVFEYDCENV